MDVRSAKPWDQPNNNKGGGRGGGGAPRTQVPDAKRKQKLIAHGIVGAVPSADKVILYVNDKDHVPGQAWVAPKRTEVKLSWIRAPRPHTAIVSDDDVNYIKETPQEDFYWEAREYLRKLAIGKPAMIEVRSDASSIGNRELGTVFLNDGDRKVDLSHQVVSAGYAEVVKPKNYQETVDAAAAAAQDSGNTGKKGPKPNEQVTKLLELELDAKSRGVGLYQSNKKNAKTEYITEFDHWNKYVQWRGDEGKQPIRHKCVVEGVMSGSMVKITIVPSMEQVALRIAGVRSPAYKRPGSEDNNRTSEPFGAEAQWTTERYTLHRDAEVIFTGFDKDKETEKGVPPGGVYYGELFIKEHSIGEILLSSGLASLVEWSVPKDKAEKYRQLEDKAAASKLKIWSQGNSRPAASGNNKQQNNKNQQQSSGPTRARHYTFNGRIKSITSGAVYQVENLDDPQPNPEVVTLSSIVVPKFGRAGDQKDHDEPFAWEAREFIRRKVIGKNVRVTLDYVRPERQGNPTSTDQRSGDVLPAKNFYTVELDGKNLGLGLIENGLGTVLTASGDNRSPIYDSLLLAQDRALKAHLGLHGPKKNARRGFNDVTSNKKVAQAKGLLNSLTGKELDGVVEYVISGNRFKVALPNENAVIILVLDGVKAPALPRKTTELKDGKEVVKDIPGEPFSAEALNYSRSLCHQQDVRISVDRQDKAGAFIGYMFKGDQNVAELLLSQGLGRTLRTKQYENVFNNAQQQAKQGRKGIWKDWDPAKEEEEKRRAAELENENNSEAAGVTGDPIKVIVHVTEVIDSNKFYCQFMEGKEVEQLNKFMSSFANLKLESTPPHKPARSEVVLALFSGDEKWYRAQVRRIEGNNISVFYGDYGNSETTTSEYIRKLPEEYGLKALAFQARECGLAYIRSVTSAYGDADLAEDAAYELKKLIYDQKLPAMREYSRQESRTSRNRLTYLNLWSNEEPNTFINGEMVRRGFAKVERRLPRNAPEALLKLLREMEDKAHDNRVGLWRNGDPGDDEEDSKDI
eukprot:TRINITY_DN5116_c0_g2_i1.p1 TRINITY_DN5116_c0_g2~~TRINITY_DN5116_c0_g2_i1.p1  ORF type:complete len:1026 (-),score=327.77 TRINITY_DN5116_c0_g2_i1:45-3122(-)